VTVWQPRRFYRSAEHRLLGGVAGGLAAHLGTDVALVRLAFVLLVPLRGVGVLAYAAFWVLVPISEGASERPRRPGPGTTRPAGRQGAIAAGLGLAVVLAVLLSVVEGGPPTVVAAAAVVAGLGVILLWWQADEAQRARWRSMGGGFRGWGLVRAVAGVVLIVTGGTLFLAARGELGEALDGLLGSAVILTGVGLVFAPYWLRMARELADERRARIRSQERAELAAHVHDSVLHTLTLIQRNVADPRSVARLARAQERELRGWLYPPPPGAERRLAAAVREVAAEVEDAHDAQIDVVCVGDCALAEDLEPLLQAAREGMVNAAKYAGDESISVYVEVEADQVTLFVRDRGPGFDPDTIPADRHGVRESIVGRMHRHGGSAVIRTGTRDGATRGTEVQLEITHGRRSGQ
jgi:signal transduction histidine kinase/phage shock protein PspC (stress-responsive transcriptional regulator)